MKFLIAAFVLALLGTACASIGFAVWDGRFHHEAALRAIHYDTELRPERHRAGCRSSRATKAFSFSCSAVMAGPNQRSPSLRHSRLCLRPKT